MKMSYRSEISSSETDDPEDCPLFNRSPVVVEALRRHDREDVPLLRRSASMDGNWSPYLRDRNMLSLCFLFIFLAYGATQNLESSLHQSDGLGSFSLGVLYLSWTISSLGAPFMVMWLGSKNAIVLGISGYWVFTVANLIPSWYSMIPASAFLGYTASILWVAEGTYLTFVAKSHAARCNIPEATAIGTFNGHFWGVFACNQVVGNLITLGLLQYAKSTSLHPEDASPGILQLFIVFLGSMTVGTVLACFLRPHSLMTTSDSPLLRSDSVTSAVCNRNFVNRTFALLLEKKMMLLISVLVYTGLQQGFIWGDYTRDIITPAFGVAWVGGVMAVYGCADAVGSLVAGKYSRGLGSIFVIACVGALAQALVLVVLLCKQKYTNGWTDYAMLGGMAVAWGVGDATFNTQISALLGILYPNDTEAAFAQWKIWQSAATSATFFASTRIILETKIISLLFVLVVSMATFLLVLLRPERLR